MEGIKTGQPRLMIEVIAKTSADLCEDEFHNGLRVPSIPKHTCDYKVILICIPGYEGIVEKAEELVRTGSCSIFTRPKMFYDLSISGGV